MSRRARCWLIAVGVGVAFLAGGLWLFLRDEPPPADQDLLSFRRTVPDEANGFLLLDLGEEDLFWPNEEEAAEMAGEAADDGEDWDEELAQDYVAPLVLERLTYSVDTFDRDFAKKVLAENEEVFRRVDDSLTRPAFQVEEPYDLPLHTFSQWRRLATLVGCRSRVQVEAGNDVGALEDALRLLRLGKKVQAAQGPLIVYLMSSVFHSSGSSLLLYLAPCLHARPEILKAFIARGADLYPDPAALADTYRAEYAYIVATSFPGDPDGLTQDFLQRPLSRLTFKPNRTRRLLAQETRLLIAAAAKPTAQRVLPDPEAYGSGLRHVISSAGLDDGTIALSESLAHYRDALRRQDQMCLRLSAARVMLALKCWHTIHERLPDTLDELVPEYLERVPLDPFDGQPLRYSREKKVLYSVREAEAEFPIALEL